jgi:hypothetical protein
LSLGCRLTPAECHTVRRSVDHGRIIAQRHNRRDAQYNVSARFPVTLSQPAAVRNHKSFEP